MDKRFTSERVLELLFDDDFESDGCGSDGGCSEGPSYLGNNELHLEELDALAREVASGGSSDEGEDDGDFVPAVVS